MTTIRTYDDLLWMIHDVPREERTGASFTLTEGAFAHLKAYEVPGIEPSDLRYLWQDGDQPTLFGYPYRVIEGYEVKASFTVAA